MIINQSLGHGLSILLLYDGTTSFLTVAQMSARLKFTQSKTYRLVRTLIKYGFLRENPGTAQYTLGLNALRLGLLAKQHFNISDVAQPLMKELSRITKETVVLTAVNGTQVICLERVESEEPVRYSIFQPGVNLPMHCGASSKILMAYLPEEEWDTIIAKEGLKRCTPNTITQVKKLKDHLREIRQRGWAYSDQEVDRDVRAVAAPVFNGLGMLVAGLSVAGPAFRMKKRKVSEIRTLAMDYARRISAQLG